MKAVLFRSHGGPEVLEYAEWPTPEPTGDQVLVRLRAAALNRMDIAVRRGWPGLKLELPHINGADGAGEVAALGPDATGVSQGDHVVINANLGCGECDMCLKGLDNMCRRWQLLGETVRGTYAEYVCIPSRQLYKLPPGFDIKVAAAAALVFQTAWHSLITRGELQAGETVVIVGAGGGVNTACISIAKYRQAQVIVVSSSADKLERARAIGADVVINRSEIEDWSKACFVATEKRGADVVVDNVGSTFMPSLRLLRKGGRLLSVGSSAGPEVTIDNRYIFYRHTSIIGSTMSTMKDFHTVMDLIVSGVLAPVIDSTFALREAAEAQRRMESGLHFGKITLEIGQ
ncbi:MAG TPA: zinc-binding dehydrogenase [Anaerolineales bacterium]|nr:zinc-binding dehydrogenase [Anaerolineales bacterium]